MLAAGASKRLGTAKQRLVLGGEMLLERAVRVAEGAVEPVFVVISDGEETEFWVKTLVKCTVVVNRDAAEGMASSIRAGVGSAMAVGADGVVILACDQPAVTAFHLRRLVERGDGVVASGYAGRRGVPAYFPARVFPELMGLRGDVGAREMLQGAEVVELSGGELDVDTVEDLERARKLFG